MTKYKTIVQTPTYPKLLFSKIPEIRVGEHIHTKRELANNLWKSHDAGDVKMHAISASFINTCGSILN